MSANQVGIGGGEWLEKGAQPLDVGGLELAELLRHVRTDEARRLLCTEAWSPSRNRGRITGTISSWYGTGGTFTESHGRTRAGVLSAAPGGCDAFTWGCLCECV